MRRAGPARGTPCMLIWNEMDGDIYNGPSSSQEAEEEEEEENR